MSWKNKTLKIGTLEHIIRYHADRVIMSEVRLRNSSPLNLGYCCCIRNIIYCIRVSEPEVSGGEQPSVNLMSSRFFFQFYKGWL